MTITTPAADPHAGRPVDPVHRERGEALTREILAETADAASDAVKARCLRKVLRGIATSGYVIDGELEYVWRYRDGRLDIAPVR